MSRISSRGECDYREKHVEDQERSGLSVAEYCRRHDLCQATFYNWRKRVDAAPVERGLTFTEIARAAARPAAQWAAEIELPCGTVVRVSAQADASLLRTVLGELG